MVALFSGTGGTLIACLLFGTGFWFLLVANMRIRRYLHGEKSDPVRLGVMLIWGLVGFVLGLLGIADDGYARLWQAALAAVTAAAAATGLLLATFRRSNSPRT